MKISVQTEDFDVSAELQLLRQQCKSTGAIVSFVGLVREMSEQANIQSMTLEHYPQMTEKALQGIVSQAKQRWDVMDLSIIHRVGELQPQDQIVLVAVSSAHRHDAFQACEFVMDYLKTKAPFWKKEQTTQGQRWVDAKSSDDAAQKRWDTN